MNIQEHNIINNIDFRKILSKYSLSDKKEVNILNDVVNDFSGDYGRMYSVDYDLLLKMIHDSDWFHLEFGHYIIHEEIHMGRGINIIHNYYIDVKNTNYRKWNFDFGWIRGYRVKLNNGKFKWTDQTLPYFDFENEEYVKYFAMEVMKLILTTCFDANYKITEFGERYGIVKLVKKD
ncbi:MAG: hypothetical protein IJL48_09430 [Bacteroidales bacterium]|nr:hypothetical protein [Bacteroidales bacterium]